MIRFIVTMSCKQMKAEVTGRGNQRDNSKYVNYLQLRVKAICLYSMPGSAISYCLHSSWNKI